MKIPTIESAIDEALEDAWAARRRIKAALIQERRVGLATLLHDFQMRRP